MVILDAGGFIDANETAMSDGAVNRVVSTAGCSSAEHCVSVVSTRRDRASSILSFGGGAHLLETHLAASVGSSSPLATGAAEAFRANLADAVDFLSDIHTLTRVKARAALALFWEHLDLLSTTTRTNHLIVFTVQVLYRINSTHRRGKSTLVFVLYSVLYYTCNRKFVNF